MYKQKKTPNQTIDTTKYRMANIPLMFDNIRVVVGSEENIFEETYVTGILTNNRRVKFKRSALVFA